MQDTNEYYLENAHEKIKAALTIFTQNQEKFRKHSSYYKLFLLADKEIFGTKRKSNSMTQMFSFEDLPNFTVTKQNNFKAMTTKFSDFS